MNRDTGIGKRVTHCAPADIALFDLPEPVAVRARLVHLTQRDVHEVVAVDKMSVECLPILQLDQLCHWTREPSAFAVCTQKQSWIHHRLILRRIEER